MLPAAPKGVQEPDVKATYASTRSHLGAEVKRRILMGTYALSAGYYDAYYQRAQKARLFAIWNPGSMQISPAEMKARS